MKNARLVCGILSIILFVVVTFQSCAVGVGNALAENEEVGGSAGFLLAICFLVAGIVGICVRNSLGKGPYTAGVFYILGALLALCSMGSYTDLIVWSIISMVFGLVFILTNISANRKSNK